MTAQLNIFAAKPTDHISIGWQHDPSFSIYAMPDAEYAKVMHAKGIAQWDKPFGYTSTHGCSIYARISKERTDWNVHYYEVVYCVGTARSEPQMFGTRAEAHKAIIASLISLDFTLTFTT